MYKNELALSIMGIQGCGKGTQSQKIAKEFNLTHISTGDLFREHIKNKTAIGSKLKSFLNQGILVPDVMVIDLLKQEIEKKEKGFILDGFPRNLSQARYLLEEFELDRVIYMDLKEDLAIKRLSARENCPSCGIEYNLINKPSKKNICNNCGSTLIRRADDLPKAISKRVQIFKKETEPMIIFFKNKGLLKRVTANNSPDKVFLEIKKLLK